MPDSRNSTSSATNQSYVVNSFLSNSFDPSISVPNDFVLTTIVSKGINLSRLSLLDSGSEISIIPRSLLNADQIRSLKTTSVPINGVTGKSDDNYYFTATITIGHLSFRLLRFHVIDSSIPVIIGNNVLKHPSIRSLTINHEKRNVTFKVKKGLDVVVPLATRREVLQEFAARSVELSYDNKLKYLTDVKGITLPESILESEFRPLIDVLYRFREVLGSEDDPMGVYRGRKCRIPTNGQSKAIMNNHIPQALEQEVDLEIQRMIKTGVIEHCSDPKGFNSPIFAVKK